MDHDPDFHQPMDTMLWRETSDAIVLCHHKFKGFFKLLIFVKIVENQILLGYYYKYMIQGYLRLNCDKRSQCYYNQSLSNMCVILRKRIESKNLKFQIIPNPQSSQAKALPKSDFY
jgi:hypothetical protein